MADNLPNLVAVALIVLAALGTLALLAVVMLRALRQRDHEAAERQMAEAARLQSETSVRIEAMRDIEPGTELTYDYQIHREDDDPENIDEVFACRCGFPQCRGTMLWPTERKPKRKKAKKEARGKSVAKTKAKGKAKSSGKTAAKTKSNALAFRRHQSKFRCVSIAHQADGCRSVGSAYSSPSSILR